jgi:hypothetical protein
MVKIRFVRQGSNTMLGSFSSGDFARVSEAVAKHLVDEALVAVYAEPMQPPAAEPAGAEPAADAPAVEQSAGPEKNTRSSRNKAAA